MFEGYNGSISIGSPCILKETSEKSVQHMFKFVAAWSLKGVKYNKNMSLIRKGFFLGPYKAVICSFESYFVLKWMYWMIIVFRWKVAWWQLFISEYVVVLSYHSAFQLFDHLSNLAFSKFLIIPFSSLLFSRVPYGSLRFLVVPWVPCNSIGLLMVF